jgi:hypothetical protein
MIQRDFGKLRSRCNVHKLFLYIEKQKSDNLSVLTTCPKGFHLTNELSCAYFKADPPSILEEFWAPIVDAIHKLEEESEKKFCGAEQPFFLAVHNSIEAYFQRSLLSLFQIGLNDESAGRCEVCVDQRSAVH